MEKIKKSGHLAKADETDETDETDEADVADVADVADKLKIERDIDLILDSLEDFSDSKLTDDDIDLVQAQIRINLLGPSSVSSPRQWLEPNECQEVVSEVNRFWNLLSKKYSEMKATSKESRVSLREFHGYSWGVYSETVIDIGVDRFMGMKIVNEPLMGNFFQKDILFDPPPYSYDSPNFFKRDVKRCIARDLERSWYSFNDSLRLGEMPLKEKVIIAKSINERMNKLEEQAKNIKDPKSSHVLGSMLARIIPDSFNTQQVSQSEVDSLRLSISGRFGLDGVNVSSSAWFTPRQQQRWLLGAEKSLEQACIRLGINEYLFGMDGRSSLEIDPAEVAAKKNAEGSFTTISPDNTRINLSSSCLDPVGVLVHEYTHHLDNVLALKVFRRSPELFPENQPVHFFSELTEVQQLSMPNAFEGFEKICQQIGDSEPIGFLNSNRLDKSESEKSFTDVGIASSRIVMNALDAFAIFHLGDEAYLKLDKETHDQYKKSLMEDGRECILEMAKAWSNQPLKKIYSLADAEGVDKPYMRIAKGLHGKKEAVFRTRAIHSIEPMLVKLNAMMHPMQKIASKNGATIPGEMIIRSVQEDRYGIDWHGSHAYFTRPTEVLARIVTRPHEFNNIMASSSMPWMVAPLKTNQIRELSLGFKLLLQSAGVPTSRQPSLGVFAESYKFASAKITIKVTKKIDSLLPKFDFLKSKKPSITKQSMHAP